MLLNEIMDIITNTVIGILVLNDALFTNIGNFSQISLVQSSLVSRLSDLFNISQE